MSRPGKGEDTDRPQCGPFAKPRFSRPAPCPEAGSAVAREQKAAAPGDHDLQRELGTISALMPRREHARSGISARPDQRIAPRLSRCRQGRARERDKIGVAVHYGHHKRSYDEHEQCSKYRATVLASTKTAEWQTVTSQGIAQGVACYDDAKKHRSQSTTWLGSKDNTTESWGAVGYPLMNWMHSTEALSLLYGSILPGLLWCLPSVPRARSLHPWLFCS